MPRSAFTSPTTPPASSLVSRRPPAPRRTAARIVARVAVAVALGLTATALSWSTADAHNTLVSTDPADGSTLGQTPSAVTLTFDEPAIAMGTQLVVSGPSGPVQLGAPKLVDNTVSQSLQGGAPAGSYTVNWRVTSDDGHPISGTFTFTTTAAGAGTPAPTAAASPVMGAPSASPPVATTLVLVALFGLLVGGVIAVVGSRVRRRRAG